ncbi:class I SAM-dependent methyltransferase [Ectopseudomonas composti]|uniref:class I SAM-dependent methyltransferase n=1 Tax=Ectopseudomonas composti TaxID=658457 RepID=UPI000774601E|nr:class I SAM-dependent methyltransferase [Pseudomonas composti]
MVSRELIARHCICCGSDQLRRSPAVLMPFIAHRVFGHEPVEITEEWGLRDLLPGMAYTLCSSLQCQHCGVLFLDYRFTEEQMAALYHGYRDEIYTRQRNHYEPGYAAIADHYQQREAYIRDVESWLAPHLPPRPVVLDWGGGSGLNTPFLYQGGKLHVHDISAVELMPGVERVNTSQLAAQRYDLIVCSQVLEHVPFPLDLIKQILPALHEQTLVYLEVPHEALMRENPGSLELAGLKRHWHEHVNFFTQQALHSLLDSTGLVLVDSHLLTIDLGWRQSQVMGVLARYP